MLSTCILLKKAHPGWFYKSIIKAPRNQTLSAQTYGARMWSGKILFEGKIFFYYMYYRYLLKNQAKVLSNEIIKAFLQKRG